MTNKCPTSVTCVTAALWIMILQFQSQRDSVCFLGPTSSHFLHLILPELFAGLGLLCCFLNQMKEVTFHTSSISCRLTVETHTLASIKKQHPFKLKATFEIQEYHGSFLWIYPYQRSCLWRGNIIEKREMSHCGCMEQMEVTQNQKAIPGSEHISACYLLCVSVTVSRFLLRSDRYKTGRTLMTRAVDSV